MDKELCNKIEERLLKEDDCWGWSGTKNQKGYQQLKYKGKVFSARSLVFELYKQEKPKEQIKLICKTKNCLNPEHMIEGDFLDPLIRFERFIS